MKIEKKHTKLMLPALRARMGDWIYYISFMRMENIAERVSFAEEIHKSESLKDLLQRRLTNRSKEIVKYLEKQEQRFFNSIIIGVYGGAPQWYELSVSKNDKFDPKDNPEYLEGVVGFLELNGNEKLFAIDGQHRVAAVHKATKKNEDLKKEEVAVIFVSAKKDKKNLERTRRLFSTLNQYAKPVKKSDIISLDEDDVVAIITRKLLDECPLFKGDVIYTKTKQIPPTDQKSITSIIALYDSLDIYLNDKSRQWNKFKRFRPDDERLNEYYDRAVFFWNNLRRAFTELKMLMKGNKKSVAKYRHSRGGHLLFRPVGLLAITRAIKLAEDNGFDLQKALKLIASAPMEISNEPWSGLLWDNINKTMITRKENQKVAAYLLFYMIGGDLTQVKITEDKLKKLYAGATNWPEEKEVILPKKVIIRKTRS